MIPKPFPDGDLGYLQPPLYLDRPGYLHYLYQNEKGQSLFCVYRFPVGSGKKMFQCSYANGKYHKKNYWSSIEDFKLPLWRVPELLKTKKPILLVEGEKCVLAADKLFPNHFVTTWPGGITSWRGKDWEIIKGREVTILPDCDKPRMKMSKGHGQGYIEAINLSRWLNRNLKLNSKIAEIPTYFEIADLIREDNKTPGKNWDIADYIPKGLDINKLVSGAVVPPPLSEKDLAYTDIAEDIQSGKWIYLARTGCLYFDKHEQDYIKERDLNNLYLRDSQLGENAHKFLQKQNIPFVHRQTFKPGKPMLFEHNGIKYLNRYKSPSFEPLDKEAELDIQFFRDHLKKAICNDDDYTFNNFEDTIAFDIQFPEKNRTHAIMIYSQPGTGKTMLFKILEKLYHEDNCSWLGLEQLTEKFRPHMLDSNVLFVSEIDSSGIDNKKVQAQLQNLIADDKFRVEVKGVDHIKIECHFTIWGSTNEPISFKAVQGDRRYSYIEAETRKHEILAADPNYFKTLLEFCNNPQRIRELYHYYKNVHKIRRKYDPYHCFVTSAKQDLVNANKPEYYHYIDRLVEDQSLDCLKLDFINANELYEQTAKWGFDDDLCFTKWTRKHIRRYLMDSEFHYRVSKEPVRLSSGKRVRLWCVRNHDYWKQFIDNHDAIDGHLNGLINTKPVQPQSTFNLNNERKQHEYF